MKKALSFWLFTIALCVTGNGGAQTASVAAGSPRYTLTISAVHRTVEVGAEVAIQIAMTNTSDQPIPLHAEIEDYGYVVDVAAPGNVAATDTERGREWRRNNGMRQSTSGPGTLLNPGETTKGKLAINDLCDLSRPGKYSIQVHRGDVKSNTITVTVVP